jgi:hypothetical protein
MAGAVGHQAGVSRTDVPTDVSAAPGVTALQFARDDLGFSAARTKAVTETAPNSLRFAKGAEDPC